MSVLEIIHQWNYFCYVRPRMFVAYCWSDHNTVQNLFHNFELSNCRTRNQRWRRFGQKARIKICTFRILLGFDRRNLIGIACITFQSARFLLLETSCRTAPRKHHWLLGRVSKLAILLNETLPHGRASTFSAFWYLRTSSICKNHLWWTKEESKKSYQAFMSVFQMQRFFLHLSTRKTHGNVGFFNLSCFIGQIYTEYSSHSK